MYTNKAPMGHDPDHVEMGAVPDPVG